MSTGLNITEPFEQILKHLEEFKKNPELFAEIASVFEQIQKIEKYTNTAIGTLQNYYLQFAKQVDILSGLIDFQTKINSSVSNQETISQIFSFIKEYVPFQDSLLYLKLNEKDKQSEIITETSSNRPQLTRFLNQENVREISDILRQRDLGVLISDVRENEVGNISWDVIKARSVILFPIRMRGKLIGFGLLIHKKNIFGLDHLAFVNLVSGFISQILFHYFLFSRFKDNSFPLQKTGTGIEKPEIQYNEKEGFFVFRLDPKGIIIHTNVRLQTQSNKNRELLGKKFLDLVQEEHQKPLQNILNQMQEGDVRFLRTSMAFNGQGSHMLELYLTRMEVQKNFSVTIVLGANITQRYYEDLQKHRNEVLDEITRFSQIANRYLQNLLRRLTPNISFLKESIKDNEIMQKRFQMLESSMHQTARLVQGFLKSDTSEGEPRKQMDINDVIKRILTELKQGLLKNVEVKYSFDHDIPPMPTYQSKIRRLLKIFAQNSVEAIQEGGYIRVATKLFDIKKDGLVRPNLFFLHEGKYIEICFEDNGMGIDPRLQPQIFKPFFSTKIRNDGIGLGLFIAYNIVKDLEGEIFVKSKQNEYTRFYIYIPFKGDLEMQEIIPGMAEAIKTKSPTILVVDDEFNIRSMLKEVFEMNGYFVFTASNGQEGVDIFRKYASQIDLIILDMVMPVMDGKSAFNEIKKIKKDQKIIIISGYAKREDLREILDSGALGFLSKPFQIDSIVKKVAGYLGKN